MYIESGKVKFYPSAYRQYQDGVETKNINPESELNTEYNITSHIAKLLKKSKGSFIVNYVENNNLEFYLGGYYIHISSPKDILDAFPNATQIWANMKVAPFTPTDNTKGFSELYEVVDYEDNNKNIDELNNNVVSFKGVAFLDTKDSNATFSLQLFTRKDTSSSWYTQTSSEYILDTSEIYNENGDTDISSEFYSLKIKTDDLYTELGKIDDATVNNTLTVNGTTTFNKQVDFKDNLVPTNNNQVDIGSSDKEFANIYVNKILGVTEIDNGQNNITLKSNIEPSGNVNLGSVDNKITNIYVNKITGVSEVDNGQNAITLKSSIVPSGNVNLGSIDNKITNIYVNDISCTNKIVTKDVDAVNGNIDYATINSNLEVIGDATFETSVEFAGDLLPTSGSQIDIGLSGTPIANVYANNLTATKINLKSQIIPDGTVTLGLVNNPITNIYATNIYGTNLKEVNEIDGGQNSITLKSNIVPDGQVDLGGPSSKFNQIYANETISDGLEALSLKVNDINSGSSFISLYKPILPTSTGTISLGNNNLKFGGIYATTFYGALSGNASTATKLTVKYAGGEWNPVFFQDGVPKASAYNSGWYHMVSRAVLYQNVITLNPNSKTFTVDIPSATTNNYVYLNMFALINFNGDKCSVNFVANSLNKVLSDGYTNHILVYNVVYRLLIYGPTSIKDGIRYNMTLQYNENKYASDADNYWVTVGSEVVQSIVIHYTVQ